MAMPIKFDTLEYTRSLVEAGIPAADAEAHANALSLAMAEATVSPGELLLLRTDVLARIEILRSSVDAKIEALRAEMNAKFIPLYMMAGLTLALQVVLLIKLFA